MENESPQTQARKMNKLSDEKASAEKDGNHCKHDICKYLDIFSSIKVRTLLSLKTDMFQQLL